MKFSRLWYFIRRYRTRGWACGFRTFAEEQAYFNGYRAGRRRLGTAGCE